MTVTSIKKNSELTIKGVFALVILLHHFTTSLSSVPIYMKWMEYIAFPIVGVFFFFSGYGLSSGLLSRNNYLNGFLAKRFSKILLPFISVTLFSMLIFSVICEKFVNTFSIHVVPQYWFIYVILAVYLVFYLIFRLLPVKKGVWVLFTVTVVYIGVSVFFNPLRNEMYASIIAFPLGVFFKYNEDRVNYFYSKGFLGKFIIQSILFFTLFSIRLFVAYQGIDNLILHTVLRNTITTLFVWLIALVAQRLNINGRILLLLGSISYYIYIIHPILIKLYLLFVVPKNTKELVVMILTVLCLTLVLSYLLHCVFSKILSNGGNKNGKEA